ncbi:uncharacterized protein FFB20_00687 [Fusarium fujikuroi]|nr:uncharacterized protein FFB20_00687 [Fusarium fujikuroi]SCN71113.1 uncharacterized protein FFE2_02209 [Fusarium fujikuroi]SCV54362.1 uncharacterized protein FFFS_11234 [Fusarium fujikuroi]
MSITQKATRSKLH